MSDGDGSVVDKKNKIDFGFINEHSASRKNLWRPLLKLRDLLVILLTWLVYCLMEEDFKEDKFTRAEIKHIRKTVEKQLNSPGPWIEIDDILLPRIGHIFRMKECARYKIIQPGSLVFVEESIITKRWLANPERMEAQVLALDSEGRVTKKDTMGVLVQDIEPIENEEAIIAGWSNPSAELSILYDGEAVELSKDVRLSEQSLQGVATIELFKGLKGIIDAPKLRRGATLDEINAFHQREFEHEAKTELVLISGVSQQYLKKAIFRIPLADTEDKYDVYLPYYQTHLEFTRSQLKPRSFDKEMFNRVVMKDKTRQKILSLVYGKEEVLDGWGAKTAFQQGRGKIFLIVGPPGTGKSMLAEALAELLERPLYFADSSVFALEKESFENGLQEVIERTERWNSVTVINEAELILESRGASPYDSSMRVGAVLRNLEKLQRGILVMTTNRYVKIDFAIRSRIRALINLSSFTPEQRKEVWKQTVPKKMRVFPKLSSRLDELAKIPINGREIRNVVLNAAGQASSEGKKHVPFDYFLAWAKDVIESREILKKAKDDSEECGQYGRIGFLKDES